MNYTSVEKYMAVNYDLYYALKMPKKNSPIIGAMQCPPQASICTLDHKNIPVSGVRCSHLRREARLELPTIRKRRQVSIAQIRPCAPTGPDSIWSYDFIFDACANRKPLEDFVVVAGYSRAHQVIDVAHRSIL